MAISRLVTGALCLVYINDKPYALVSGMRFTSSTPTQDIFGIDSMESFELAPTVARVEGSMSIYRQAGDGGAEGAGITVPFPDLPREKYFRITVIERRTQKVIFNSPRCKVTSQSWDIPSRGYVTGSLSFTGVSWSNETPLSAL